MLFVEVKSGADTAPAIAAAIRDASPAPGAVALQGYDADALAAAAALLPGVPTYWDVDPPYRPSMIDEAVARGFTGLALDHRGVDDALVAAIAAAHLSLDVWTVDDAASIAVWLSRGARYVETNRPRAMPVR
jgi:glycerophosphoryl diester phosphodiesterase